jgi:hypothetical protein
MQFDLKNTLETTNLPLDLFPQQQPERGKKSVYKATAPPTTTTKLKAEGVSFEEAALHNGDISVYRRWVPLTEEDKQLFYSRGEQYRQFTYHMNKHENEEFSRLTNAEQRKYLLANLQPSILEHYNLKTFHYDYGHVLCNCLAKNFRAHEHNFGKAAQKRFFTCFDNYINIFESTHSTNRELLQYTFNNGHKAKTDYRKPVFMTLTVPRQVRYTKTITITEAEAVEHLRTIKTEKAPGVVLDADKLKKAYATLKDLNFPGRNCIAEILKMLRGYVTLKKTEQIIFFRKEKPTQFTVSIGTSDKAIKKNCLDRFFENLKKTYGMKMVLWKAEAQLRGVIHFHCLIDAFILESTARKLWYGILKREKLHNPTVTMQHSSNLTNFQIVPRLVSMKYEFAGYFAHQTDRHENIKYKHRAEKPEARKGAPLAGPLRDARVRNIEGNTWGSTDNLKYRPFTITDIDNELVQDLLANAFEVKPYKTAKGDVCGGLYLTKKCELVHCPEVDSEKKVYQTRKISLQYLEPMLHRYHYAEAEKIYNNLPQKIDYHFNAELE